jgi:hypothetical protein
VTRMRVEASWEIDYDDSRTVEQRQLRLLEQMNRGFLDVVEADGGTVVGRLRVGTAPASPTGGAG